MTTKDVGDYGTWTLTVSPSAGDTAAVATVISPAGVSSTPGQTANVDKSVWTSTAKLLDAAGLWICRWTVTGTGAGVEPDQTMLVAPTVPVTATTYATTTELATWLQAAPPTGCRRLLVKATRAVDDMLKTAVYDVDANGLPTDADVIAALRDATCAQAEWMVATGDTAWTGAADGYQSVSIGSLSLTRAGAGSGQTPGSQRYAPEAISILMQYGLLQGTVYS